MVNLCVFLYLYIFRLIMCCMSTCVWLSSRVQAFLYLSTSFNMCFVSTNVLDEFRNICVSLSIYQLKHEFCEYQCFGLVQECLFERFFISLQVQTCVCLCFGIHLSV